MKDRSDSLLLFHSVDNLLTGGYLQHDSSTVISKQLLWR